MSETPRDTRDDERADAGTGVPGGEHAAPRPYPPSLSGPGETSRPVAPPPPDGATTAPPDAAPTTAAPVPADVAATTDAPGTDAGPATPAPVIRSRRDVPEAPRRPGVGRHVLAAVLGLLVTPVALLLVGVGLARLADIAGTNQMGTDALGIGLLVTGALLLAAIGLLGVWSPALPIAGGLVWGIGLGTAYLAVPAAMDDAVASVVGTSTPAPLAQLAETAMSGYLVLVGLVLWAGGLATAVARRRGRRWGEQAVAAERAQAALREAS